MRKSLLIEAILILSRKKNKKKVLIFFKQAWKNNWIWTKKNTPKQSLTNMADLPGPISYS